MGVDAGTPPGLWERVRRIAAEEVARFAKSGFLRNARVSGGDGLTVGAGSKFRVEHPNGRTMLRAGIYDVTNEYDLPDGSRQPMYLLAREDGTIALAMYDPSPDPSVPGGYRQFLALYDRGGNTVLSDDTASGQDLARPYVPGAFYRSDYADWVTATGSTFVTKFRARIPKQHPRLYVRAWASNDTSGSQGEVRVLVNGVEWGAPQATQFVITEYAWGPQPVDGDHMSTLVVELQARVTSGAGGVRLEPGRLDGQQS